MRARHKGKTILLHSGSVFLLSAACIYVASFSYYTHASSVQSGLSERLKEFYDCDVATIVMLLKPQINTHRGAHRGFKLMQLLHV